MTKKEKNKLNSDKQKVRLMRMGLKPRTYPFKQHAYRAIKQVAINFNLRDFQALDKIIKECPLSKRYYKRFK